MINEPRIEGAQLQQTERMDTNIRYLQLLNSLPIEAKTKSVLDVGCGLGVNSRPLINKFECEYYGVDERDFEIIEAKKVRDKNIDGSLAQKIHFECGDATKLDQIPTLPPKFDMVVSRHPQISSGMKPIFQKIFESAFTKLAKGGVFLVTTLNENEYKNARNMFKKLGIEIDRKSSGLNPYSNGQTDQYVLLGVKRQ